MYPGDHGPGGAYDTRPEGAGVSAVATRVARPASELARRWSALAAPGRDHAAEHRAIEEAAPARDADRAAGLLRLHVSRTVEALEP